MEEILKQLLSDVSSTKHVSIKHACRNAVELLGNKDEMDKLPTHLLREKCLEPFQLAMETKSKKLGILAVHGIQKMLSDERFHSSMETESEEYWMPVQVLNAVFCTPSLSEEVQVEVMKLLLNLTFSASWCMTAGVITKVTQVYIDTFMTSSHSVKGAIVAALTQVLGSFTDKFLPEQGGEEKCSVMDDFNNQESGLPESSCKEIVLVLKFFTSKLEQASSTSTQIRQSAPLLLEAISTILSKIPKDIRSYPPFQEILWKSLCPSLICLLGNPKMEKTTSSPKHTVTEDVGRGSGCSSSAPNLHLSTAKTVYSIALSLVDLMGRTESMRPVLESVFHRMLLYPPAQHRLDSLKAVREVLKTPSGIFGLALPTEDINLKSVTKNPYTDVSLIKLIVDSIQESCHCNDTMVCITSVACVNDMLGSLEQICRGVGVTEQVTASTDKLHGLLKSASEKNTQPRNSVSNDIQQESLYPLRRQTVQQQIILQEEVERRYTQFGSQFEDTERQSARMYIEALCQVLPRLAEAYSVQDVDEELQRFSSRFCRDLAMNQSDSNVGHMTVLNADSVYVVTMTTLHLNYKLLLEGYYESDDKDQISVTEKDFLDEVLGCGLMLFVSPAWLSEVYSQTISNNILKSCGCSRKPDSPIFSMIKDIDGIGHHDKGGQFLSDVLTDDTTSELSSGNIKDVETGKKFTRRILARCWDSISDVLSVLLNGKNSCGITSSIALMLGTEGAKEESFRAREAICMSLEGLQKAARLCCILGMPQRCGSVFSQLATTSCVMLHTPRSPILERKLPGKLPSGTKQKPVKLHASHVLSMDVMMTTGLEMGSHSADCWKHLFRCTAFISELEHTYFSQGNNQSNLPKLQHEQTTVDVIDDDEMYGVPVAAATPVAPRINIPNLINQSKIESAWERSRTGGGVLNAVQASQALCALSQQVDRLFEEAAEKLNLSALLEFLNKLCESSQDQLMKMLGYDAEDDEAADQSQLPQNALHLYRLQEVLMKIVSSNRPLLHLMRVWSVVSGFLVEAAGHRARNVSKMAVTCVHDFVQGMISNHQELEHFHINEFLCKTFENMLCLELCDQDVQDQVVCSVCELVEACTADLKSGWRPLFGALRAVKIEHSPDDEVNEIRQRHVAAVLDVFEVFLNTDNILVFANAAVDCILCLLKYVRGPGDYEDDSDDDSDSGSDFTMVTQGETLCIPALGYLKKCNTILQTMWKMPACPVFNGAHRINSHTSNHVVDDLLPNYDMEDFKSQFVLDSDLQEVSTKGGNSSVNKDIQRLQEEEEKDCTSLDSVDSGITLTSEGQSETCLPTGKADKAVAKNRSDEECAKTQNADRKPATNQISDSSQADTKTPANQISDSSQIDLVKNQTPANANKDNSVPANVQKIRLTDSPANVRMTSDLCSLEALDNDSGILHVWFLMIDGLAGCVASCPKNYQPETLDMLFDVLKALHDVPGPFFSYYCVNHLLLPMLQSWLRLGARKTGYWDTGSTNFKQCCGLTSDLVVDFIVNAKDKDDTNIRLREFMLKQTLDILIECIAQPVEVISRLGCSCIRHVFLSAGKFFSEEMWQISAVAMEKALDVTTYFLQQLMMLFSVNSDNFYGDLGQVKVAMRKDSSPVECERLRHLAQQVFLLDTQVKRDVDLDIETEADKSFVFLLYKPGSDNSLNPDDIVTRIPFRNVVIGLLSNQLLLQTVGSILLSSDHLSSHKANDHSGLLNYLSVRNIIKFLHCLRQSYKLAAEFDSRPGLKFLIQKVARTEVAVNLYKQAGASMVFFIHTLLQICVSLPDLSANHVKCITGAEHFVKDIDQLETEYLTNMSRMETCPTLFLQLLRSVCDELCHTYVDILYDETSSKVDQMSEQQVFFIIAQPDEFSSNFLKTKKKSRSESETSQDKECVMTTKDVPLQEVYQQAAPDAYQPVTSEVFPEEPVEDNVETASLSSKHMKSKREMREEQESKVYTLATDTLIKSLMTEYKKRKQQHAMPNFVKISKEKKPKPILKKSESIDETIAKQRKTSIMKDSEGRIQSWTELLCTTLGLFQQQPDTQFRLLQPAMFYCVNQLVCHAEDRRLREALGQWVHRIGVMMDFVT